MATKSVAALVTEYFRGSHADVLVTKILEGYDLYGERMTSRVSLASMYLEQVDDEDIGEGASSSLFQIVREALDQAVRRGPPGTVKVALGRTRADGVELVVSDDGAPERRQAVIDGLAERAAELNGTFDASRNGRWTTIRIVLPPSAARL